MIKKILKALIVFIIVGILSLDLDYIILKIVPLDIINITCNDKDINNNLNKNLNRILFV